MGLKAIVDLGIAAMVQIASKEHQDRGTNVCVLKHINNVGGVLKIGCIIVGVGHIDVDSGGSKSASGIHSIHAQSENVEHKESDCAGEKKTSNFRYIPVEFFFVEIQRLSNGDNANALPG